MNPIFFESQEQFREWLEKYHETETELIVGYYKVHTGKPSMTWSQSVDQALCFGWIDGVRRSIDEDRYCIRFTPRRKSSIWSTVNIHKVEALIKAGLMHPHGLEAYSWRRDDKSSVYAYENERDDLDAPFEKQFKKDKRAWTFFNAQAPSYRRVLIHWIMRARQEKTRQSRLDKAIVASREGRRLF